MNNDDSIKLFEGDLKDKNLITQREYFDVVTMNPPYKAENSGIKNGDESAKLARHEIACNIDDITECAARILRFGGRLCICHRPERLSDAIFSMKKNGIEPKRMRFVQKNGESAPWLVLIDGRRVGTARGKTAFNAELFGRTDRRNFENYRKIPKDIVKTKGTVGAKEPLSSACTARQMKCQESFMLWALR